MNKKTVEVYQLGLVPYADVWRLQKSIFNSLLNGDESDYLILCEHYPVYTLGRATDTKNILFDDEVLARIGAEKFEIERGGDVTYHGPGQLVGYPLMNLSRYKEDLGWFLRSLEESIIRLLELYDIGAYRIDGRTGVWVNNDTSAEKICAIGIKASRWITMHGYALNVSTDLSFFEHIIPCGISDKNVTSMQQYLGTSPDMEDIKEKYLQTFADVFHVNYHIDHIKIQNELPDSSH